VVLPSVSVAVVPLVELVAALVVELALEQHRPQPVAL